MIYKDKLEVLKKKFLNSVGVGVKEVVYCFVKLLKVLRDIIFINILLIDDCVIVIIVKKDVEFKKLNINFICIECSIIVKWYLISLK